MVPLTALAWVQLWLWAACGIYFTLHRQCEVIFPLESSSTLRKARNCPAWNYLIRPTGLVSTCSGWRKINGFTFTLFKVPLQCNLSFYLKNHKFVKSHLAVLSIPCIQIDWLWQANKAIKLICKTTSKTFCNENENLITHWVQSHIFCRHFLPLNWILLQSWISNWRILFYSYVLI